jgi:hypothetical protein
MYQTLGSSPALKNKSIGGISQNWNHFPQNNKTTTTKPHR